LNFLPRQIKPSLAIVLGTLAISASFLAQGTTQLVASKFLPAPEASSTAAAGTATTGVSPVRPPGSDIPDLHAILARNAFDPTTGALWPPKVADVPTPADGEIPEAPQELAPGEVPPPCEGSLRLIAAVYFDRSPEWSFATVATGSDAPLLYRQGSKVNEMEVFSILPKAVFMRLGNGRLCSILLFADPVARAAAAAAVQAPVTPPVDAAQNVPPMPVIPGAITESDMDQNIVAQGEAKFTVQRTFVDKILQNQAEIMRSARIVPHEENGQVVGVKLYGIRRNSLLGKLGLQNGDLLRTINGFAMSSPDTALEAYSRLRTAANLSVAVTRRGREMNVDYDITKP